MTVAVVPDGRVRALNYRYRRKDRVTDVLSFVAEERGALGDVVIAAGLAARQARQAGHSLAVELRVLALHGLLHLLGYDHETDDGRMARLERRLRRKGGLVEGLIERGLVDRIRTVGRTGNQAPTAGSRPRQPRGPRRARALGWERSGRS